MANVSETSQRSLRWRFFLASIVLLICALVAVAYGLTQDRIQYGDGYPYDASSFVLMAKQVSQDEPMAAEKPFIYRVGLPYLVGTIFPDDLIDGFCYINLIFGALTLFLLYFYLSTFTKSTVAILTVLLLFVTNPIAPFRLTLFYPALTDAPALFAVLLIFYVYQKWPGFRLAKMSMITFLSFVGVLFREIDLMAPLSLLCASVINSHLSTDKEQTTHKKPILLCAVAVAAALIGIVLPHFWVQPLGDYSFKHTVFAFAKYKLLRPDILVLAIFISYGPILALLLVTWNTAFLEPLRRHPELAAYLVLDLGLSVIGGWHTDRFMYWAFPAVLPLLAIAIDVMIRLRPSVWSAVLMASLFVAQILAFRAFAQIPNATIDVIGNPGSPSFFIFAPYGNGTNWGQVFAASMAKSSRVLALSEYALLLVWLQILCLKGNLFGIRDKFRTAKLGQSYFSSGSILIMTAGFLLLLAAYAEVTTLLGRVT